MPTQPEQPQLLVRGYWLFPGGSDPAHVIRDGALAIHDGKILEVGSWTDLKERYPSTFTLYGRLEEHKKIQVYNEFRVTGSFKAVSKKVLNLLYGI